MDTIVSITSGRATSSSLLIAEHFNKRHSNVIRSIKNIECSDEFGRLNFEPSEYTNSQGKKQPYYNITRDGFVFLAMGFTGKEAARWKERYIKAFNYMESLLTSQRGDYNFPLLAASPKDRFAANDWLTAEKLQSNRKIELDLIDMLEKDGYDVSGVKARILGYHFIADMVVRQNVRIQRIKELVEALHIHHGLNVKFVGNKIA